MVNHKSCLFDAIDQWFDPVFGQTFFSLPFQISYRIVKAFIFNKNEGNNQKVENKVSGRVLHYVKIAGCSAMYTNVTCCK